MLLRTVRRNTVPARPRVGVFIETFAGYLRDMIAGVSRYVRQENPRWEIVFQPRPDDLPARIAQFGGLDGLIAHGDLTNRAYRAWLQRQECPVVLIEQRSERFACVEADNVAIGRMAFEHLQSKGLRDVAVWHLQGIELFEERRAGFAQAAQEAGHRLHEIPREMADVHTDGAVQAKVVREWIARMPRPFGLFVPNVEYARRVVAACRNLGLDVPQEVAVLGVDRDELVCDLADPPVSVIDHGMLRAGFEAAALVHRMMHGEVRPRRPVLVPPVGVVERQSTDVQAADDPDVRQAMRVIRERAIEGLQVRELLREVPVARRTLEVAFRTQFGRSIRQEIQRVRINRAKQLLVETECTVEQIARMCGYAHGPALTEAFARETGMPPTPYRKQYR